MILSVEYYFRMKNTTVNACSRKKIEEFMTHGNPEFHPQNVEPKGLTDHLQVSVAR